MPLFSRKGRVARGSTQRFEYKPLINTDEIRVLAISSSKNGDKLTTLKLSMQHISLTSSTNYTAVSYMWGSSEEQDDILIDDCVLTVRPSLKRMILDLGNRDQSRLLWIDAVCINQLDNKERGAQVRLMGSIYLSANYVIAYVKGTDHKDYNQDFRDAYLSGASRKDVNLSPALASIRDAVLKGDPTKMKKGLNYARFFDNDYFTRRWVIQEICLARSVIIRCDGFELTMGLLDRFFTMADNESGYAKSRAANICNLRQQMTTGGSKLEELLYNHEQAICRDRLDKVYALLSLSSSAQRHIHVDYDLKPIELLMSVVYMAALHEQLNESRIVSFACFLRRHLEITSQEIQQGMRNASPIEPGEPPRELFTYAQVQGVIRGRHVDAVVEDGLNRLRPFLPSLRHYQPNTLTKTKWDGSGNGTGGEGYRLDRGAFYDGDRISTGVKVNAVDFWAFSCAPPGSDDPPSYNEAEGEQVLAGMSSGPVRNNDEVWRFPRTPVAFIVRWTEKGYTLIARALILNSSAWETSGVDAAPRRVKKLDNVLNLIKTEREHISPQNVRNITLDAEALMGLMQQVDVFDD